MPGWLYALPDCAPSAPPKELLISVAPIVAARFSASARSAKEFEFASTSRILHLRHIPRTACTSSVISPAQPVLPVGRGDVAPSWFTTLNEVDVSAGSPYCVSKAARSAATV